MKRCKDWKTCTSTTCGHREPHTYETYIVINRMLDHLEADLTEEQFNTACTKPCRNNMIATCEEL